MGKFYNLKWLPLGLCGPCSFHGQGIISHNFDRTIQGKRGGECQGEGKLPSNLFGYFIRALELLISNRISPFPIIQVYWFDTITPWENKQKITTNKHVSVIFLLAKKYKISHFCRRELGTTTTGFSDTQNVII